MGSQVHRLRRGFRAALAGGRRVVGTFVKLPTPDVVELAAAAGFDFIVVDLEHSTLSEQDALALVRYADACGLPALVRVPGVDPAMINRLLENGAAGLQLSMLQTLAQARALRAAAFYAPAGRRSVSLANRVAEMGAGGLAGYLAREAGEPALLVGQLETVRTDPLDELLPGLDACFVGSTDLCVDLGVGPGDVRLREAVDAVHAAARRCAIAFGGWTPSTREAADLGLADAGYLVVGSDLQILAAGLRAAAPPTGVTGARACERTIEYSSPSATDEGGRVSDVSARNPMLFGSVVNWDDIPVEELRPGVRRRVYATDEVMIARHELEVGMQLNPHRHADFDQLVYIASGRCNYYIAGTPHDLTPGSFLLVPRGSEHYVEPTEAPCVNIDVFVPPRANMLSALGWLSDR